MDKNWARPLVYIYFDLLQLCAVAFQQFYGVYIEFVYPDQVWNIKLCNFTFCDDDVYEVTFL